MSSPVLLCVISLFPLTLHLILFLPVLHISCFLFLLFCPSACCCADGSPEHIHVSSKNISSLWLLLAAQFQRFLSPPSNPPVITIVTYGSTTPSPFTKPVFLSQVWATEVHFFSVNVYLCKDLCKCSFSGSLCLHNCSALFLTPVKSILALWMTPHTHTHKSLWDIRHVMGAVTGLKQQNENSYSTDTATLKWLIALAQ